jgi:hypothetical protein
MLAQYEFNKIFGIPNHPPCANCGKINGGFMSSTAWEHSKEREECLRYRIKHLEKQLKLLGHKPIGTPEPYKEAKQ